jgi:hypothetical protein
MERTFLIIAMLALGTIWLVSSPGNYNRHDLIKNSEVIAYVNVDDCRYSKNVCQKGDTTVESAKSSADVSPVYAIKGHLDSRITVRLPST